MQRAVTVWARALGCDELPAISQAATDVELSTYEHCAGGDSEVLL